MEGLQGRARTQRPRPLAKSICSKGAAPPARSSPLWFAPSTPCQSYRLQWCSHHCESHVQLGPSPSSLAHSILPPHGRGLGIPRAPRPAPQKKPRQRQGRGPGARRTFGATCGKEVPRGAGSSSPMGCERPSTPGSRRAGCKLPGAGTHTPHPAPARKGPMHHLPPSE